MRSGLILLAVLGFGGSAYAANCKNQFAEGSNDLSSYKIAGDYVELEGLGTLMKTSSEFDYQASAECLDVMNDTVHLPYYGRVVAVELFSESAQFLADGNPDEATARIEIDGTAHVDGEGKSDVFQKAFTFKGTNPATRFENRMGELKEQNSVCGKDIRLEIRKIAASFFTAPNTNTYVEMRGLKLRVKFAAVDPNDPNCINRPGATGPGLLAGIPFGNGQNVEIVSAATQKCVDIADFAMWNAAEAQQWDCAQSPNQLFRVSNYGDNMTLQALHSNQCLTIGNGAGDNGARATQTVDCSQPQAHIKLGTAATPGAFTLRSASTGKCLDVHDGHVENGLRLQQWDCVGTKWQEWWINPR